MGWWPWRRPLRVERARRDADAFWVDSGTNGERHPVSLHLNVVLSFRFRMGVVEPKLSCIRQRLPVVWSVKLKFRPDFWATFQGFLQRPSKGHSWTANRPAVRAPARQEHEREPIMLHARDMSRPPE